MDAKRTDNYKCLTVQSTGKEKEEINTVKSSLQFHPLWVQWQFTLVDFRKKCQSFCSKICIFISWLKTFPVVRQLGFSSFNFSSLYNVIISVCVTVCLFWCLITTQEYLDRFASNYVLRTRWNHGHILSLY